MLNGKKDEEICVTKIGVWEIWEGGMSIGSSAGKTKTGWAGELKGISGKKSEDNKQFNQNMCIFDKQK